MVMCVQCCYFLSLVERSQFAGSQLQIVGKCQLHDRFQHFREECRVCWKHRSQFTKPTVDIRKDLTIPVLTSLGARSSYLVTRPSMASSTSLPETIRISAFNVSFCRQGDSRNCRELQLNEEVLILRYQFNTS